VDKTLETKKVRAEKEANKNQGIVMDK